MSAGVLVLDVAVFHKPLRLYGPDDARGASDAGVLLHALKDDPTLFPTRAEAESAIARTIAWHTSGSVITTREEYEIVDVEEYEAGLAAKSRRRGKAAKAAATSEPAHGE